MRRIPSVSIFSSAGDEGETCAAEESGFELDMCASTD